MEGKIIHYNSSKGYGFVKGIDEEKYFFHISDYKDTDTPNINDAVKFIPNESDRGKTATFITVLNHIGSRMVLIESHRIRLGEIKSYNITQVLDSSYIVEHETLMENYHKEYSQYHNDHNDYIKRLNEYNRQNPKSGFFPPDNIWTNALSYMHVENPNYYSGLSEIEKTEPKSPSLMPMPKLKFIDALQIKLYNNESLYVITDIYEWQKKLDALFNID